MPYENFVFGLKSKDVKRQYPVMLIRFLNFAQINGDSIEGKCASFYEFANKLDNRKVLESILMQYITFQQDRIARKEICTGTLRNYIKAIKHFFVMNDIIINWDKIKKGLLPVHQTSNDRIPEISEIKSLLNYNDIRIKPIVYTMLSSGIRVGAWNYLKWKNIIPIEKDGDIKCAKIIVYDGEPEQYFSFITPEAFSALKEYMIFRELHGEKIDGESWLMRDQWQKINKTHGHRIGQAGKPKKFDSEGIRRLLYDSWKVQGVLKAHEKGDEKHHPFKSSHGFRKFFETRCELVIKSLDIEILLGHGFSTRGLKANYYRPSEDYLCEQFLKAVELLTIDDKNKLSLQINYLEDENKNNQDIINKMQQTDDAYTALSDKVMEMMKEIEQLKAQS